VVKAGKLLKVRCPRCGYVWNTRSRLIYVVCPSCRKMFKKEEHIVEEEAGS